MVHYDAMFRATLALLGTLVIGVVFISYDRKFGAKQVYYKPCKDYFGIRMHKYVVVNNNIEEIHVVDHEGRLHVVYGNEGFIKTSLGNYRLIDVGEHGPIFMLVSKGLAGVVVKQIHYHHDGGGHSH
jgi:hypothetical protein